MWHGPQAWHTQAELPSPPPTKMHMAPGAKEAAGEAGAGATFALTLFQLESTSSLLHCPRQSVVTMWEGAKRNQNPEGDGSVCDQWSYVQPMAGLGFLPHAWLCARRLEGLTSKVCLLFSRCRQVSDPHSRERQ